MVNLFNRISHKGKTASSQVVIAGCRAMLEKPFTNMEVAGAFARAGFEPDDLWVRQEIANRLLQKIRKLGLATFDGRVWTATAELRYLVEG